MPPSPKFKSTLLIMDSDSSKSSKSSKRKQTAGRISAACEACKKRKTKCTGGPPPCQLCRTLKTECVIDLSLDMRRRAALQRTIDESRSYQDTLNNLLDCVRSSDVQLLQSMSEFLRSNPSSQEINAGIHRFSQLLDLPCTLSDSEMLVESPDEGSPDNLLRKSQPEFQQGASTLTSQASPTSTARSWAAEARQGEKDVKNDGQFALLLRKLRTCSIDDGEKLLKDLFADETDLTVPLQRIVSPYNSVRGTSTTSGSTDIAEQRKLWHPILALESNSEDSFPDQEQAQTPLAESTSASQLASFPVPPMTAGSRTLSETFNISSSMIPALSPSLQVSIPGMGDGLPGELYDGAVGAGPPPYTNRSEVPFVESGDMSAQNASGSINNTLCVAQEHPLTRLRIPTHLVLPLIVSDSASLSRVYTDYFHGARQMIANGTPLDEVLGSDNAVCVDLFFRPRQSDDGFDCASWACELMRTFPEFDDCARLASIMLLTYMMRWLLVPTQESYQRVPEMMRPTATQRMIPHIGAIELMPIPIIRDAAINELRDFHTPFSRSKVSINWPHSLDTVLAVNPTTGSRTLTKQFVRHASTYKNWSVGQCLIDVFPEANGRIRLHQT